MNFIKAHLISRIKIMYKKNESLCDSRFLYFDNPIPLKNGKKINRVNAWYPFVEEELVNSGWHDLPADVIKEIYFNMKYGKFYGYKIIDGKKYKLRKKC